MSFLVLQKKKFFLISKNLTALAFLLLRQIFFPTAEANFECCLKKFSALLGTYTSLKK